ncbi:MAG: DUF3466 family protein [Phycisphaerales bacterium]|nr:MAG: DUF3466 family protein [Phycisphaerales bacterium]
MGLSRSAKRWASTAGLLIIAVVSAAPAIAQDPVYVVTDLGTLNGTGNVFGYGVNGTGEAVGQSSNHAFLWVTPGPMQDLGTLGGFRSTAVGVNDSGQVVGYSTNALGQTFGFFWTDDGGMISIGALESGLNSWANAINGAGQVVGQSTTHRYDQSTARAFLWTKNGGMIDLGTLGGGVSGAFDINDYGEVVGSSATETSTCDHAYFLADTESPMEDLGTLGGACSYAYALNNSGHVVGTSSISGTTDYRAFLWTRSRGITNLGTLGWWSWAYDINDVGDIVGSAQTSPDQVGSEHAVIWIEEEIFDLNDMIDPQSGWVLAAAVAINESGQIVGSGDLGSAKRAFLLTPAAPEPDGDFDGDGIVDLYDHTPFAVCMDGPGIPPQPPEPLTTELCLGAFDFDGDDDVDVADFGRFVTLFGGS